MNYNKIKKWFQAILASKDLNTLVIAEAKALKSKATKRELQRLDFDKLDPVSTMFCIYGQMTGDCNDTRANSLVYDCAKRVYDSRGIHRNALVDSKLNGAPKKEIIGYRIYSYFSPIEKFIAQKLQNQKQNNKILIEYLKGEREMLEFVK